MTAPSAPKQPARASANMSTRLPLPLIQTVKQLAQDAGESPTDFVRTAIENEVSRRSLCQPKQPANLDGIKLQLTQINERLARSETAERQTGATLKVIAVAMGVDSK